MYTKVNPLDWQTPIVDPQTGLPSQQFIRLWQQMFLNADTTNGDLSSKADKSTQIIGGFGLSGGGTLAADRTIDLDATLDNLNDVDLTVPPSTGQALVFDGTDWGPGTVSGGLEVQEEGVTTVNPATILNFIGAGVTVTNGGGGLAEITIPGGTPGTSWKGALVYNTAAQSVANLTNTVLTWDAEVYDQGNWFNAALANDRFIVPAGVTRVRMTQGVTFVANATGIRVITQYKNGAVPVGSAYSQLPTSGGTYATVLSAASTVMDCVPGDYFQAVATQSSGAALNTQGGVYTFFAIEAITESSGSGSGEPPLMPFPEIAFNVASAAAATPVILARVAFASSDKPVTGLYLPMVAGGADRSVYPVIYGGVDPTTGAPNPTGQPLLASGPAVALATNTTQFLPFTTPFIPTVGRAYFIGIIVYGTAGNITLGAVGYNQNQWYAGGTFTTPPAVLPTMTRGVGNNTGFWTD